MDDVTDAELARAEARGKAMLASEPRALTARYEASTGRVMLELTNGCSYAFPTVLVQDLQEAGAADLADVWVDGNGFNLHFPALDVDLFVPALVAGIFGTKAWMTRELARAAGSRTSPSKAMAARVNGAKGGRPRKVA